MSRKTVFKSKALPRIKDSSKTLPRVDPDQVAESLGAKKKGRLSSGGSPISQNATRLLAATRKNDASIAAQSSANNSPAEREVGYEVTIHPLIQEAAFELMRIQPKRFPTFDSAVLYMALEGADLLKSVDYHPVREAAEAEEAERERESA